MRAGMLGRSYVRTWACRGLVAARGFGEAAVGGGAEVGLGAIEVGLQAQEELMWIVVVIGAGLGAV